LYSTYLLYLLVTEYTTGTSNLKIINASRSPIHKHENLKSKLYNYNANTVVVVNLTIIITCKLTHNGEGPSKDSF